MKLTMYDEKKNTLYIRTEAILPNTDGMSFVEHCKKCDEAFAMSYDERIRNFASKGDATEIRREIKKHKGCVISEFTSM